MNIQLNNRRTSTTTINDYDLEIDGHKITYREYLNEKGKLIDFEFLDEFGNKEKYHYPTEEFSHSTSVENFGEFVGKIQAFVDSLD